MFSEVDAFLDAIFEEPDDDTPRLVYADWLEEHGQVNYARFIRLQCAAAREKHWSPEANRLWEEISRVWNRLYDEWWPATIDDWPGIPTRHWSTNYNLDAVHFDRGFLRDGITLTGPQVVCYTACWAWLPTPASNVVLTADDGDLSPLASMPLLRRVRRLSCWLPPEYDPDEYHWEPESLDAVLRSPFLCNVRVLDLSAVRLGRPAVDLLLTAPNLGTARELYVDFDRRNCDPDEAVLQLKSRFPRVVRR
jgi:uncharacterized protein (TIGR02996 family)